METAMAVASVAGTALSAVSAMQGGQNAQAAANYNAAVMRNNAEMARRQAEADAVDIERKNKFTVGNLRATAGASGLLLGEGGSLEAELYDAHMGELNILKRKWQGKVQSDAFEAQARLDQTQGEQAAQAGLFRAGATLISGVSKVKGLLPNFGGGGGGLKLGAMDDALRTGPSPGGMW